MAQERVFHVEVFHCLPISGGFPWLGDWFAVLAHAFKVEFKRCFHVRQDFLDRLADGGAAQHVRAMGAVASFVFRIYYEVRCHRASSPRNFLSRPACFKILGAVFLSKSALIWPGTVPRPGFSGCLYLRWPPLALIRY